CRGMVDFSSCIGFILDSDARCARGIKAKKPTRYSTFGVGPRRLTRQRASRRGRAALHLVIRKFQSHSDELWNKIEYRAATRQPQWESFRCGDWPDIART